MKVEVLEASGSRVRTAETRAFIHTLSLRLTGEQCRWLRPDRRLLNGLAAS
jgi:hypothetical protein